MDNKKLTVEELKYVQNEVIRQSKSLAVAYFFVLLLNGLGIHRIYLGKKKSGVLRFILTLITAGLIGAIFVSMIELQLEVVDIKEVLTYNTFLVVATLIASSINIIWGIVDLFLIPDLSKELDEANREIAVKEAIQARIIKEHLLKDQLSKVLIEDVREDVTDKVYNQLKSMFENQNLNPSEFDNELDKFQIPDLPMNEYIEEVVHQIELKLESEEVKEIEPSLNIVENETDVEEISILPNEVEEQSETDVEEIEISSSKVEEQPEIDIGEIEIPSKEVEEQPEIDIGEIEIPSKEVEEQSETNVGEIETSSKEVEEQPEIDVGEIEIPPKEVEEQPETNVEEIEIPSKEVEEQPETDVGEIETSSKEVEEQSETDVGEIEVPPKKVEEQPEIDVEEIETPSNEIQEKLELAFSNKLTSTKSSVIDKNTFNKFKDFFNGKLEFVKEKLAKRNKLTEVVNEDEDIEEPFYQYNDSEKLEANSNENNVINDDLEKCNESSMKEKELKNTGNDLVDSTLDNDTSEDIDIKNFINLDYEINTMEDNIEKLKLFAKSLDSEETIDMKKDEETIEVNEVKPILTIEDVNEETFKSDEKVDNVENPDETDEVEKLTQEEINENQVEQILIIEDTNEELLEANENIADLEKHDEIEADDEVEKMMQEETSEIEQVFTIEKLEGINKELAGGSETIRGEFALEELNKKEAEEQKQTITDIIYANTKTQENIESDEVTGSSINNVSNIDSFEKSTFRSPYLTVNEAIQNNEGENTVSGYVIGALESSMILKENVKTNTNIVISDDKLDNLNYLIVKMPKEFEYKEKFSLNINPDVVGKKIKVKGNLESYFGKPGIKKVSLIEIVD